MNEGEKIDFIILLIALLLIAAEFVGFLCMIALEQCFSILVISERSAGEATFAGVCFFQMSVYQRIKCVGVGYFTGKEFCLVSLLQLQSRICFVSEFLAYN